MAADTRHWQQVQAENQEKLNRLRQKQPTQQPRPTRRNILVKVIQWVGALVTAALIYPLLRFTGYTIKRKPRYVTVSAPLPASGFHAEQDFILFAGSSTPIAVSRTCTHLGCRVNYLEDKKFIECPCHQSRFSTEGKLLHGPAKKDLPSFPVEIQADETGKITGYLVTL